MSWEDAALRQLTRIADALERIAGPELVDEPEPAPTSARAFATRVDPAAGEGGWIVSCDDPIHPRYIATMETERSAWIHAAAHRRAEHLEDSGAERIADGQPYR